LFFAEKLLEQKNFFYSVFMLKKYIIALSKSWFINIIKKSFILQMLNMGFMLVSSVMLARILGPEDYGQLTYIMSIVGLLTIPVALGLPTYLTREVAKSLALEKDSYIKALLTNATFLVTVSSLFVVGLVGLSVWVFELEVGLALVLASLSLFLVGFNQVRMGILKGYHEIIKSQIPEKLIKPFFYIVFIAMAYIVFEEGLSVVHIIVLHLASLAVAFFFGLHYLKKFVLHKLPAQSTDTISSFKPMVVSLLPFSLLAGLQAINQNIDLVMLGALIEDESEVAFFKIAFRISMFAFVMANIVNSVINPRIAEMYSKKQFERLQKFVSIGSLIGFLSTLVLSIFLFIWGNEIIVYLYGNEYKEVILPLIILLIGKLANTFFGPAGTLLMMVDKEKLVLKINVLIIMARLVLDLFLIRNFGVMGAVFGVLLTTTVHSFSLFFIAKKTAGINTTFLGLKLGKM